jgi:hypothetical protein
MRKHWYSFVIAACLSLVALSGWLLLTPITTLAATCSATCRTGSVSCEGNVCRSVDYDGCYYTVNGVEKKKACDSTEGGRGIGPILE